ncbi:pericentrin [Gastrophryne carolinensis]
MPHEYNNVAECCLNVNLRDSCHLTLAHSRQQKTKGQSSKAQKTTKKRKGEVVPANGISPKEDSLIKGEAADQDPSLLSAVHLSAEVSLEYSLLDVSEGQSQMSDMEAGHEMKQEGTGDYLVNTVLLQTPLEENSLQNHQELHSAVCNKDEIITQLSSNLQQVLLNRKEMEDEALCLSNQIQAIQLQLQDASRVLKHKSLGNKELHEAQQQFSVIHSSLMDQTFKRAQDLESELEHFQKATKEKENLIAKLEHVLHEQQERLKFLQEKLDLSESSVNHLQQELTERNQEVLQLKLGISVPSSTESNPSSDGDKCGGERNRISISAENNVESLTALVVDLNKKLAESESIRESLIKKIEKQMEDFEMERLSWEQKHNDTVLRLKEKLFRAEQTVAQEKNEKDCLNQEIRDLKESLRLKEENHCELKLPHEEDLPTFNLKLQTLDKVKLFSTEKVEIVTDESKTLILDDTRVDHFRHDLEDIKKNLSRVKARKDHYKITNLGDGEKEDCDDLFTVKEPLLLDKYLIPSQSDPFELSYSNEDIGDHSRFELDSDFALEHSIDSTVSANLPLFCSPMPITGVLAGGATLGKDLDPESFAVYLSSNLGFSNEKNKQSLDIGDDALQRCRALTEQLQNKEEQLQKCSNALEEAVAKWKEVTAELEREQANRNEQFKERQGVIDDLGNKKIAPQQKLCQEQDSEDQMLTEEQIAHILEDYDLVKSKLCVVETELENMLELKNKLQTDNVNLMQNLQDSEKARELERQEFDNKLNSKGMEQQMLHEAIKAKEGEFFKIEKALREELNLLKNVNEDLESKLHEMNAHNVDAEALRLSLTNMHTAHLELSQSNLLKEKDNALVQLRETLNDKRAQEVALLQSRHQFELAHLQEKHDQELKDLKHELTQEILRLEEEHSRVLEQLRAESLEMQENYRVDLETIKEHSNQSKEEWTRQHDQYLQELKQVQDKLQESLEQIERRSKDAELLKEQHASEVSELHRLHKKERDELKALAVEKEKQLSGQQDIHSKELELLSQKQAEMMEQMKSDFSEEIKQLREQHDNEKATIKGLYSEERRELEFQKSEYYEELKNLQAEPSREDLLQQHSEEICSLKEKHAMEVLHLSERHEQEIKSLIESHVLDRQEWESQKRQEIKQAQEVFSQKSMQQIELHQEEINQVTQKYTTKLLQLQDLLNKEKEELLAAHQEKLTLERQQGEYSEEILQLKEQCKEFETLHKLLLEEKEDWKKDKESQSKAIQLLKEEICSKTSELQEQHLKAIKDLQEQHSSEMKEVEEQHVLEREEWEKERDLCSQELDLMVNQHSQELKRIGEEISQASLQKQEEYNIMFKTLQEDCSKEILNLQNQHRSEVEDLMLLHSKEREQWGNQTIQAPALMDQDLGKLEERHEKELRALLESHEVEKMEREKWQEDHFNCLNHLVNHHFQEVKRYLEEHSEQMEEHADKILELQEEHQKDFETMQELYSQKKMKLDNSYPGLVEDDHDGEHAQPLLDHREDQSKDLEQDLNDQVPSSQQIQLLWAQVDSSRASRQELNELKDQLIARSMHLEEIERMKQEFHKQQQQLKAAHEKDMEDLRIYFEQKSSAAEETYRENVELLHQRLRNMSDEGKEEMPTLDSSALALEEHFENEKTDLLLHLTDQLALQKEEVARVQHESEKHRQDLEALRSLLAMQYEEEVANVRRGLSDKYALEVDSLKRRHSLEMEHLRARLSERHIKEITKMHLESSWEAASHKDKSTDNIQLLEGEELQSVDLKTSEQSSRDLDMDLKSSDKDDKTCQTDSAACFSSEPMCAGCSSTNMWEVGRQHDAQDSTARADKMASEMAQLVKTMHAERTRALNALKEVKKRTRRFLVDKANLQRTLSRELQTSNVSKDETSELISYPLTHNEDLNLPISGEEIKLEPDSSVSELHEHFSELGCPLEQDIQFPSSDSEGSLKTDLLTCLLELLKGHQEELHYCDLEHTTHVQSLEASHLLKLDTLEASYLSEIQKIRDEHALSVEELELCLSSRLQEKENEIQERLERARVHWLQQQEQELQRLRRDLASMHLEKFQAMAEELKVAHQDDLKEKLDQQCLQLEYEKSQALDALKEEVLRMEERNALALQELSCLHEIEVQKQTQALQDELTKLKADLQKQEAVAAELGSQRQALSIEVQEKTSQLLQLQEEIELLKCQSEMLLEQQITQLKEEFVAEKRTFVQELEQQFARDLEKGCEENKCLVEELDKKSEVALKLQEKISALTKEMEAFQSQMEAIVQTRERENQEGKNLETILQSEAQIARQEQGKLQESSQRLLKILTDVLRNTLVTEDLIFKKVGLCLDSSLFQIDEEKNKDTLTKSTVLSEKSRLSPDCDTITEHSLMSTDEGYEVSEYLCDTVLGSLEVGLENEDKIVQMSQRLRSAVERLLDMVSDSAVQLEQTREIQKTFEEEFKGRNQDMAQLLVQNQELQKQLAQEMEMKNELQVELHKAQGLLEGFAVEKSALEEVLSTKESSEHQLVLELEKSQEQLKVLTQEPSTLGVEKELLLRLQEVLSGSEKDTEVELLKEVQRLVKEKLELHCQADKDRSNLLSQMRVLEMELEEQMSQNQELMGKTSDVNDLKQQIQSLEKQLKHQRHFMDEQAVEREHERDDFQQEIQNLEEQLKQALKSHGDSRTYRLYDWSEQNEPSETSSKENVDLNLLLEEKKHLEQQIAERNDEIDKMLMRIQEVEQAALSNADAAKRCNQLEADLQRIQRTEKELLQDKEALQQQQYNNVLQISALQSKLDEARHRLPGDGEPDALIKRELQAEREALQRKEKEVESLVEQLEFFREELTNKTEEVLQLNMQLEIQRKQSEITVQHAQEEYLRLKDELSSLQVEKAQDKPCVSLELPQALLQEKNQEIDHLNEQILSLQQEAADVEELRSLVEHLRSDQERLRKSKEEEMEQLHEVIEKLQQELEQLGPIRHEVSDSQESLDRLGLVEADNLQAELSKGAQRLADENVEENKSLYGTELEALRQQLEDKEGLETDLQNLQRLNMQHEQALEFLQGAHRNLQEELELLRTHLSQREEVVVALSDQIQRLQDSLREKNAILTEKELLVQTLQEQHAGDISELRTQLAQCAQSLEATKIDLQKAKVQNISLQDSLSNISSELNMKELKHNEEIKKLKENLRDWEEKSEKLLEEVQTQTEQHMNGVEAQSHLDYLKEQLHVAENLAGEQNAELLNREREVTNLNTTINELRAECECWKTEAQHVQLQLKKRDACVAELQSHSQNLGTQVKKLQEALKSQEAMISVISVDLQKQTFEEKSTKPHVQSRTKEKHRSFSESVTDLSAWDSPDMVRKQEEPTHSLGVVTPYSELSIDQSAIMGVMKSKSSGCILQSENYNLEESSSPSLSDSVYSLQQSIDTQRTSPVREIQHPLTDYDSFDDQQSYRGVNTESDQYNSLDYKTKAGNKVVLDEVDNLYDLKQKMESTSGSGLSPQLQRMLNMVHQESCKILELSELPITKSPSPESTELVIQRDMWLKEKQNLQETIQSLSSALAQAAGNGEKASSTSDWRRELLQSVQSLLESERGFLRLELQSQLHYGTRDNGSLSEKVEHLIKEQEEQKRLVLEHVLAVDRSSLLSEIQDLRAQLRLSHLQNQEKLQQLQDALTSAEEKGHTKEHQLRKQVELYEYKMQQEAAIAEDLKASLLREQDRSSEQHRLLLQEQSTISHLRSELEVLQLELEKMRRLQKEMQMEITKLRDELESKEQSTSLLLQTVQSEQKEKSKRLEEEKAVIKQELAHKEKSLQEAYSSVEEHRKINSKISSALSQEQTCTSNLRKELEIEQSRCQALLAQEHKKLMEVEQELGREKQHSASLSSALTLERNVVEQLRQQHSQEFSRQDQERQQEHKLVLNLQGQLEEERKRARDLAAMMEQTQQQVVHAKRRLESENQACREEIQKEQEAGVKLRALLEALQSQKQQLENILEQQREREIRLQKERDQYQAQLLILQEEERVWIKERDKENKRLKQADVNRIREEEQERQIMDLKLQHERDVRRIQDLQHMLADLEEQERALAARKSRHWADTSSPPKNLGSLASQTQKVWQQLLHIALQVKKWVQNRGESFPNEAEVSTLLDSLSALKLELTRGNLQVSTAFPPVVVDVLKRENEELATTVSQLTKEKLELRNQLAKLNKSLQEPLRRESKEQLHSEAIESMEAERAAWNREKRLLQIALKHAEAELGKASLENKPVSEIPNSKVQRLYRKYLRAESFRKALVYQKKYLLLLLGGFQACEKATLSLIARMGVYPSPGDLQVPAKRQSGLTKFRSAVRAVIAISRLKFLVRKWHKGNWKGAGEPVVQQVQTSRREVLQHLSGTLLNSPPTRDTSFGRHNNSSIIATPSPKTSNWASRRIGHSPARAPERSPYTSQDPEHSITEYIHHLEMVQRRLGGGPNAQSPELPGMKYARK